MVGKPKLPIAKTSPSEYKKLRKDKYKLLPRVGKYLFPTPRSDPRNPRKATK